MSSDTQDFNQIIFGDNSQRPASTWPRVAVESAIRQQAADQPTRPIYIGKERSHAGELNLPDSLA